MAYLMVPWAPGVQFEVLDSEAAQFGPQDGVTVSRVPFAGVPMQGQGGGVGGGMQVDPDLPIRQWALKYLLDTGQLGVNQAQAGINAYSAMQNAANTRFANQANLVGTILPQFNAMRGPANLAQYENLLAGQSSGGVPAFLAAAAGLGGGLSYNQPAQSTYEGATLENQGVGDWIKSLFGGSTQSAATAPRAAGDAMTQAVNAAGNAPQTPQAGQQAASAPLGVSHGAGSAPGPLAASGGTPAYTPNPMGRADAQLVPPATAPTSPAVQQGFVSPRDQLTATTPNWWRAVGGIPLSRFPATAPSLTAPQFGARLQSMPDLAGDLGRGGDSDIRHKGKEHDLIERAGFGHGSDARNRAYAAAGMRQADFNRAVKRGKNPLAGIHAAEGLADVITDPTTERVGDTTVHMGEGGADELRIILPLERGQPIPAWALDLANRLSPDRDHLRGSVHLAGGGVIDASGRVVQANKPFGTTHGVPNYLNSAGQVQARSSKAGKYTTMPSYRAAPMAIPQTANATIMQRIRNTPSLLAAFNSAYEARGGIADDFWAQLLEGLGMLGNAPRAQRIGRAF